MASYGATDPGWPGAGNSNWPPAPSGSGRPIRGATDIPGPRPPMRVRSVMPARYQADEEDQNQRLGTHSGTESSANFGRSLHAALHDGHLNTIEDLKDHPLPSHWMDMSHDLEGIKQFTLHGGIFLWLVMIVSSVAGLITIYSGGGKISVFWISIVAVIPLAIQLGDISVLLSHWCGPMAGGLINATFSNATELLVLVSAVRHGLVAIEQAVLIGGILSNMLFVLGVSFIAGGVTWRRGQTYDVRHARTDIGVLFVSSIGVLLPTAFALIRSSSSSMTPAAAVAWTLSDSRETAFILLAMYAGYLVFRLWPEAHQPPPPVHGTAKPRVANRRGFRASDNGRGSDSGPGEIAPLISRANSEPSPMGKPQRALSLTGVPEDFQDTSPPSVRQSNTGESVSINLEDLDKPMISAISCVLMLVAYASLVAIFANALITSVFPVALAMHIPIDLIAVVLIPMVGNIAALFSSVVAATHDHMDLSLAVALGSATQIGMFLMPFAVLYGWMVGVPFSLDFETAYALAFFTAVIAFALLMMDGEANYMKGLLLLGAYLIVVTGLVNTGFVASVGMQAATAAAAAAAPPAAGGAAAVPQQQQQQQQQQ